jgi:hypothetical protein
VTVNFDDQGQGISRAIRQNNLDFSVRSSGAAIRNGIPFPAFQPEYAVALSNKELRIDGFDAAAIVARS